MSKFADNTDMYVGTLIADEIGYAGATTEANKFTHYLVNNYTKSNALNWWVLSPYAYYPGDGGFDLAFRIYSDGELSNDYLDFVDASYSFRPSVNLKSGINITKGNGTKTSPYVVS